MEHATEVDDPELVRAELARIIASPDFSASDRNRRFFVYVVEEALAGRGGRIKAYTVATTVFGRDEHFDAQLDSIVRIEAGRLRRALEHYYLTAGAQSPIRIDMPRGTYAPVFTYVDVSKTENHAPRASLARASFRKPVILVLDMVDESPTAFPFLASGLTRQIVVGLTRFSQLRVFGQQTVQSLGGAGDLSRIREELSVDFFVAGGLFLAKDRLHVDGLLIDAHSGCYLWAEAFDRPCDPSELLVIRDEIAGNVVRNLAQPWGAISTALASEAIGKQADDMTAFDAIVCFNEYAASFDPSLYPKARSALERALRIDPEFGEAWACLSRLQTEAIRFGFRIDGDPLPGVMLNRAIESARRAIGFCPRSSQSFLALGIAYWFKGDIEGSLAALSTAVTLNPNDTEALAELGFRNCLRKDWDQGVPQIVEAYDRNPALPSNYRVGLSLWHMTHGRMQVAHDEAMRMSAAGVLYRHFLIAVTSSALGRLEEVRDAINAMLEIDPSYASRIEEDLMVRNVHPDLIMMLADSVRAAGLKVLQRPAVGVD
jgi:TolB-like protein